MFLISTAIAQTAGQASTQAAPNPFMQMLPMLAIIVVLYFFMIRPQQKRQKEMRKMLSELKTEDEVIISGGIYAKIISVSDEKVVVDLDIESTKQNLITIQKSAVQMVLPKGSLSTINEKN
jgi:preprotein translocase subunit YajC